MTELCSSGPRLGERTVLADDPARYWVERWGPGLLAYKPEFLIAMLPDPDRSRSGFRFDLWVESLQRASQRNRPKTSGPHLCAGPLLSPLETRR